MSGDGDSKVPWWQTLSGLLTAAAAIVTALTGLLIALHQLGLGGADKGVQPDNIEHSATVNTAQTPNPNVSNALSQSEASIERASPLSVPQTTPQTAATINLLSEENGGQLLLAPGEEWGATNDGKEDVYREVRVGEEGVFAFKGDRSATFDTFYMLIPKSGRNPKEFELLAGNESPAGEFQTIATFHPQNVRLMKTGGWQEFKFAPVTAKYFKIKLRSNYEDVVWLDLYEFRLLGQLNAAAH